MNFSQLRCFIYVVDNLSFTVAARKLDFSQSAISKNIKELEKEVNVKLLDRSPHKLMVTDAGKYFYQIALDILKKRDSAVDYLQHRSASADLTQIRIGMAANPLEHYIIPLFLQKFNLQCKDYDFTFIINFLVDYLSQLQERKIDLALLTSDVIKDSDDVVFKPYVPVKYWVALPFGHPLEKYETISLNQLCRQKILLPYTDRSLPDIYQLNQTVLSKLGPDQIKWVDEYFLMYDFIKARQGVGIIPNFCINKNVNFVSYRPLKYKSIYYYGLTYLRDDEPGNAGWISDVLEQVIRKNIIN
ncbi:LysR family transcriptional regulator [Lactobacillus kullabergensis]|uniref:LysR family transcriptional regulator n=1 Tax=Lactobacillus TaxID=1578 RepID=UPI0018DE823F|nr:MULTISPECIES: LysR family transcriptional regulator [Lactobacillus]MBI0120827.1 LysR family transcriptional regulator [Lactobacillus sp. M0398]MBI0122706.1 LysR family transcriptional regulator [Lactobacillus sp. W8174]MBI0135143.1 LysR family transcriptional regulator [Lactobacillus sp. W8173]MCX0291030.1 LysR family transcriptional regulator [Lactobacillus kullabergensis]